MFGELKIGMNGGTTEYIDDDHRLLGTIRWVGLDVQQILGYVFGITMAF